MVFRGKMASALSEQAEQRGRVIRLGSVAVHGWIASREVAGEGNSSGNVRVEQSLDCHVWQACTMLGDLRRS